MSVIILVTFWSVSAGFVTAGLFASLYQLVTNSPLSFHLIMSEKMRTALLAVPLLLFSGPIVITRNAWQGRTIEQRQWRWIMASIGIVTLWSFITGLVILDFTFRFAA